jgi:bifunctional non-homologous end joining protein LigD
VPPTGREWVHEIKWDGYRLAARRDGNRFRLWTRRGYNWTKRYPRIVEALGSLAVRSITIDGEAVCCGRDGKPNFDTLHSNCHEDEVFLYAFDLLELNREDYRSHALEQRKAQLQKLMRRSDGIRFQNTLRATERLYSPTLVEWAWKGLFLSGVICLTEAGACGAG